MAGVDALAGKVVYLDANVFVYAVEVSRSTKGSSRSCFEASMAAT